MRTHFDYHFSWDAKKAIINQRKHGVSFEIATGVFHDALMISILDEEHSFSEERWITIGKANGQKLMLVVHTYVEINHNRVDIRMISARHATKYEQRQYEETIQ